MPAYILHYISACEAPQFAELQLYTCVCFRAHGVTVPKSVPSSWLCLLALLSNQEPYSAALQLHPHKYLKGLWSFACMHCFPMGEIY